MGAVLSLALLAAETVAMPAVFPPPEEAVARLQECGFSEVSSQYDDLLQDEVVVIADTAATDQQLECAAVTHLATGYWTELPEALRSRYFEHYSRLSKEQARQRSLRELAERGELERLPAYHPGQTDDVEFARKLEDLCGERAQGMLQSEFGPHSVSPQWALGAGDSYKETGETLFCVMRFAWAAGFDIHLIGNEKVADSSAGQ